MDKIVIFLSGERGIKTMEAVSNAGHKVCAVFVPPNKLQASYITRQCMAIGAELISAGNVNDEASVSQLSAFKPNLVIIAGFSQILTKDVLDVPVFGVINLHAGRLPNYRGGSPLNWQIINGEKFAGLSVIRTDDGIDTGDILGECTIDFTLKMTISELHAEANLKFPELVCEVLEKFDDVHTWYYELSTLRV